MRQLIVVLGLSGIVAGVVLIAAASSASSTPRLRGFSAAAAAAEIARERAFMALPSATAAEADFDVMTRRPHHTGSPYEIELATYVAGEFARAGLDVSTFEYSVLLPWPGQRRIDIVAPDRATLAVEEETLPGDRWAAMPGILPAYNAYSPSGEVTADVVYVNYGLPEDYDALAQLGVDVKGRIVLARYGGSWRGIKPKVAAEHGAIGCIIYSDPHEDGFFQGDTYPNGPFRASGMIQRGSVMDMPRYPGDPSTPGRPSKPGVERLPFDRIETLASIPVQPMSARDAAEILKRLEGPPAPVGWRGSLPVAYRVGPGPARVHMTLEMDYAQRRVINVIGRISGAEAPDEWVIAGSHRDAWTFGAADSVSGHVSMMSAARAMGEMLKTGWRPRRTIVFASWDGEEQGLLGSTEWVEEFEADLREKAVVYLNRDAGAAGLNFTASAVHSLTPFLYDLAKAVQPGPSAKPLFGTWLEQARSQPAPNGGPLLKAPPVGALGSGSDYTAFVDHAGVASIDIGLTGRGGDGTYHSSYDHPDWFKQFIDPRFEYNVLASRVTGVALLRLADADIAPFDYDAYGRQILEYIVEIERQATMTSQTGAAAIDFTGLRRAAGSFMRAGAALRSRADGVLGGSPTRAELADINRRLVMAERDLTEPAGLPGRPWYRHVIYAPGLYTGYGVKTIPGVREAVDAGDYARAAEQAGVVIRALQRATSRLRGVAHSGRPTGD